MVVETFSLLAVGTSLIGTLLGASQFFVEQMTNLASSTEDEKINQDVHEEDGSSHLGWKSLLESNRLSYVATGAVVVPTVLIAAAVPDSFSIATDIAVSTHQSMSSILAGVTHKQSALLLQLISNNLPV
jgi:hypothetical protein